MKIQPTFAIGDIHGSFEKLIAVLAGCRKVGGSDSRFILLGDYIDRGPDSMKVVELLMKEQQSEPDNFICLLPASDATSVLFLTLTIAVAGRVAFGRLADLIGAIPAYLTASLWQAALIYFFTQISDLRTLYVFAPVYGFGYAGVMTGLLATVRELTPPSRRSSSIGTIIAFAWLGHSIGSYQGGLFFDLTGSYNATFANAALAGAINLIIVGSLYLTIKGRVRSSLSDRLVSTSHSRYR